jgi:hypothetical protein
MSSRGATADGSARYRAGSFSRIPNSYFLETFVPSFRLTLDELD